jgi:glycosyltransferase involved in cell wall biosynthesis
MRLSCIIPAYNEAARIGAVLDAVLGHPWIDEVIVVDDGSTDQTARVAARKGVQLVHMTQNAGKARALAAGIALATGDWLMFIDSDLTGLTQGDLTRLIQPVLAGQAHTAISLRRNAPLLWRLIGLDYISGERVMPKEMLADHLHQLDRMPRFGIEVFLNTLWIASACRIAVVRWPEAESPTKTSKHGVLQGLRGDLGMLRDIFQTIGAPSAAIQILRLLAQRVRP